MLLSKAPFIPTLQPGTIVYSIFDHSLQGASTRVVHVTSFITCQFVIYDSIKRLCGIPVAGNLPPLRPLHSNSECIPFIIASLPSIPVARASIYVLRMPADSADHNGILTGADQP